MPTSLMRELAILCDILIEGEIIKEIGENIDIFPSNTVIVDA